MMDAIVLACLVLGAPMDRLDLSGTWRFELDPENRGMAEGWQRTDLPGAFVLPGSTDERGEGEPARVPELGRLTREHAYVGAAWYQREVEIPPTWAGRRIELRLERVHWESRLWFDGEYVGMENSLCVPHVYDLTRFASPGTHRITLRVDNTLKINVGHSHGGPQWAHSVTDETQTNWNGVIGEISLAARSPVWVREAQVHPELAQGVVRVKVALGNAATRPVKTLLRVQAACDGHILGPVTKELDLQGASTETSVELPLGDGARLWDEFDPNLYTLTVCSAAEGVGEDAVTTTFGLRDFAIDGQHFVLNGRTVHLRGNLECCVFPRTGYPPMDVASWRAILSRAREYGLNHVRFHSWCPPEAAFAAADQLGFMLQVEAPVWDGYGLIGQDTVRAAFIAREADRIVDTYGNHPSFCLLSLGNELGDGTDLFLQYLVDHLRRRDGRRFYTSTTHPVDWRRDDDYFVGAGGVRGQVTGDASGDYRASLTEGDRPVIAHEIGQYAVLPDLSAGDKYTGPLKARYLDFFRDRFAERIDLARSSAYAQASGALAALLYKEEIEAQLRTPNLAGFQLLGLQDFPGQGVALVGMLDAFWDSKGIITPESWRSFCGPTVAVARLPRRVWSSDETLEALVEVRHHGPDDLDEGVWRWEVTGGGRTIAEGAFPARPIPTGGLSPLGELRVPLADLQAPGEFSLRVFSPGGGVQNAWRFWVYPTEEASLGDLPLFERWGDDARAALARGESVLLAPERGRLLQATELRFQPVFWSAQLFGAQPDCMGILVDPTHPVFDAFPTRSHTDWQWEDLLQDAESVVLDGAPRELTPLVEVIPDFNACRRMSPLWEAKVGAGRLLVCTLNLSAPESSPARRQFLAALRRYIAGDSFRPETALTPEELDALLAPIPEHALAAEPERLDQAALHVRAARHAPSGVPEPWDESSDQVVRREPGYGYRVEGSVWRDAGGAAWHGERVSLHIDCPRDFTGALYVFFHDWNRQNRVTRVFFDGRDHGPLSHYHEGKWLRFDVAETETRAEQDRLTLLCQREAGPNVMISEIALVPAE